MFLQIENIDKSFAGKPVLHQVSLGLTEGEILVLLGASGCGKTTLLRILAGLEMPDNGRVFLRKQDITGLPTHQRNFGFVFQDYALFPHKNVVDNIAFGLRMQNWSQEKVAERVRRILDLVGLADFGQRDIHDLSGGEQQRVALARSLAPTPRLLLLDEPLGALDRALRERLMLELRRILKEAGDLLGHTGGITAVYVTHDQTEAFAIADRIAVMNAGQIEQVETPSQLYRRPATPFVARFLGMENIVPGKVVSTNPIWVQTAMGKFQLEGDWGLEVGQSVPFLIRPEAASVLTSDDQAQNVCYGRVQSISFRGRYQIVTIATNQFPDAPTANAPLTLKFELDTAVSLPAVGTKIRFTLDRWSIVPLERG